ANGATVCLTISSNNTTGGKNGSGSITAPGIGLRENHSIGTLATFNINGLSPDPASDGGQMEGYVNGLNPQSASGTFGVGGTSSIDSGATYHNATCTIPLLFAEGGVCAAQHTDLWLALGFRQFSPLATFARFDASAISAPAPQGASAPAAKSADASLDVVTTSLTQPQLNAVVAAAIKRWSATGLTPQQIATLRAIKFESTDLSGSYLGEAEGDSVLVDRSAGGKGWYIGCDQQSDAEFAHTISATRRYTNPTSAPAGHVDLLTAIEHEMGHHLRLPDTYAAQ